MRYQSKKLDCRIKEKVTGQYILYTSLIYYEGSTKIEERWTVGKDFAVMRNYRKNTFTDQQTFTIKEGFKYQSEMINSLTSDAIEYTTGQKIEVTNYSMPANKEINYRISLKKIA